MILELLRISCAAPERHRHHGGQRTTERDGVRDGVGEEEVVDRRTLTEEGGGRVGRQVWAVEREQGRTASDGGKDGRRDGWRDGQRMRRRKRDGEEDRRRGRRRDAWSGDGNEGKERGRRERNTAGGGEKEERDGRRETRGKEVG